MKPLTIKYNAKTNLDFATALAVEVTNPLSYIQFSIDLLSNDIHTKEEEAILEVIHNSVDRINNFTNNISITNSKVLSVGK